MRGEIKWIIPSGDWTRRIGIDFRAPVTGDGSMLYEIRRREEALTPASPAWQTRKRTSQTGLVRVVTWELEVPGARKPTSHATLAAAKLAAVADMMQRRERAKGRAA